MEKYYLSQSELGILLECLNPTTKYNLPSLMELGENVDVKKLKEAINKFAHVHPGIFTILRKDDEGGFYKEFLEEEIDVPLIELEKIDKKSLVREFELFGSHLYRFEILKVKNIYYLFFDFHHIIADGGSIKIFIDSLETLYKNGEIQKEKQNAFEYGNYEKTLQNSTEFKKAEAYYKEKYSGIDAESTIVEDIKEEKISHKTIKKELKISAEEVTMGAFLNCIDGLKAKLNKYLDAGILSEVTEAAEKAKFSSQGIDRDELQIIRNYCDYAVNCLEENSSGARNLFYKYIVCIY